MTLLNVEGIETFIGQYHILQGISLEVTPGEITVLLGRNGAGKTTTLRSIMGLNPISQGSITFKGERIERLPTYAIARKGIGYVPEDQGIFADLTVQENMKVAMRAGHDAALQRQEWILELFPDLRTFWQRKSGHLSGGQKQMLAIARAYVGENELLLIDEPSKGLAPIVVEKLMQSIEQIKKKTTVLLVEQNFFMASRIGDRYYIVDEGRIVLGGRMKELREDPETRKRFLGIA
ncbi:ABC transporter ATP-binding protein [Paenibacillus alginolyticus]|uniref:ABC transporter ATP-binding protein n=1 Tax=Paenibacillus alginolyticus TaxID=59839 RepID=A0ABT4GF21_9BACL|nr:ABC transporter ATP-binding protein [Paenibacillus alginolyticus]MCY9694785.1 ABC transporter ATP-binding protein [Paenibacillus alginolyticus]MEC0145777.1 ABC transporter ATP-binding protein [Paenibacillus alginolyticus]